MICAFLAAALFVASASGSGEGVSVSSPYWTKGMPLTLRLPSPEGAKDCSSLVFHLKSKSRSVKESHKKSTAKDGGLEIAFESSMGAFDSGLVEIEVECKGEKLGSAKVRVLKALPKTNFDKATPEQLEKVQAILSTDFGSMRLEFYPQKAPDTVRNFFKLSAKGFYDGTTFHRIVKDFMIQGGDPEGTGNGGPGYTIKAEFNDLPHVRGTISMARDSDPDTAGSQFFIVHAQHVPRLDRQYAAFGKLLDGLETLDKIASVPVGKNDDGEVSKPLEKVLLKKVFLVEKPPVEAEAKKP